MLLRRRYVILGVLGIVLVLLLLLYFPHSRSFFSCEILHNEIKARIEVLNYCNNDEDCEARYFVCPFGCFLITNKNVSQAELEQLYTKAQVYTNKCDFCLYECPELPKPKCVNNKCVIGKEQ